jgi:hypothetical protein
MDNSEIDRSVPTSGVGDSHPNRPDHPTTQAAEVQINDTDSVADYANFCRISGTPEELLIDFGLNPQPMGTPTRPIAVTQRIVTSWHTAKRLLGVLQTTVARHEAVFGVLETDVQRRIRHR